MRTSEATRRLAEHPLLDGLSADAKGAIHQAGLVANFKPGDTLLREGQPASWFWLLLSGTVKVGYSSPDGAEVMVKVFAAPAAWGEIEVLTCHEHIENVVAVDRCTTLQLPAPAFERLMDAHPRFMKNVLRDTCARFFIAAQNERALAFLSVPQRLANLLLSFLRIYGVPVDGGVAIRVRLTQAGLAADLGVAKKSVTRTLAEWRGAGFIQQRGTTLVVTNVEALLERSTQEVIGLDWIAGRSLSEGRGPRRRL